MNSSNQKTRAHRPEKRQEAPESMKIAFGDSVPRKVRLPERKPEAARQEIPREIPQIVPGKIPRGKKIPKDIA